MSVLISYQSINSRYHSAHSWRFIAELSGFERLYWYQILNMNINSKSNKYGPPCYAALKNKILTSKYFNLYHCLVIKPQPCFILKKFLFLSNNLFISTRLIPHSNLIKRWNKQAAIVLSQQSQPQPVIMISHFLSLCFVKLPKVVSHLKIFKWFLSRWSVS